MRVLKCVGCEYELSGLPEGTTCPECGIAKADMRVKVVEDPSEISYSRLATILLTIAFVPILFWMANAYWSHLYATSRWGRKGNMSELSISFSFIAGSISFLLLVFAVSVLPWRMSRKQMLLAACPAILPMFALNILAVRSYWEENVYLDAGYLLNVFGLLMALCVPLNYLVAGIVFLRASNRALGAVNSANQTGSV